MVMSKAELVWATPDAERLIVKMARVSNPSNEDNFETGPRLLKYLIEHKHWSPFEMANMCVKIHTERDIAAQILRHRSFSFQEFCLAGDARITIVSEKGIVQRLAIAELHRKWQSHRFKARYARAYDPSVDRFITAPIKSVYCSGEKPVYEFAVAGPASVRTIRCTCEHRVLTKERGFVPFGVAFDNELTVALNGAAANPLPYQDPAVLKEGAWMGSTRFACEHGIADVTARKWFRKHGIVPAKPNHAGASSVDADFSARLNSFMKWARAEVRKSVCERCGENGSRSRLELSHVVAHDGDPALAFDENNLQTLCAGCHRQHDIRVQGKSYGWTLGMAAKWGKITSQIYLGIEQTYDIEMDHPTHNFVADGIVVHNSTRYSRTQPAEIPYFRRQDTENRQNSLDDIHPTNQQDLQIGAAAIIRDAFLYYESLLERGVAKETARRILPLCTPTTMYMNGTVRSWVHYLALRTSADTQLEHRQVALDCQKLFRKCFPAVAEAAFGTV